MSENMYKLQYELNIQTVDNVITFFLFKSDLKRH